MVPMLAQAMRGKPSSGGSIPRAHECNSGSGFCSSLLSSARGTHFLSIHATSGAVGLGQQARTGKGFVPAFMGRVVPDGRDRLMQDKVSATAGTHYRPQKNKASM